MFNRTFVFNPNCTMSRLNDRIPEDKTQEVFTLAAQLYAEHNRSYSVQELMEAGTEAKIPPEFIQQAIEQLELQHSPSSPLTPQPKRSKILLISLATALLAFTGAYFFTKDVLGQKAQVKTVQPVANQPQLSDTNSGTAKFNKCTELKGKDLRGANLQGADCANADLANADLTGANLAGANLSGADLENTKLNGAKLQGTDLAKADLSNADLSEANIEGANLSGTDLKNANLENANLKGADLARADLEGANLKGTNTQKVNPNGATTPNGTNQP